MIRNYLTIAFRILWNNKVFSLINILGLAIGMAAALILIHYIRFEKSYDSFHENVKRIYRLNLEYMTDRWNPTIPTHLPACGPMLKHEMEEVLQYVRLLPHKYKTDACILTADEDNEIRRHTEDQEKVFFADATIFSVFSFPLKFGNPATALKETNTIALSEATAKKYFGDTDPTGKFLHLEDWSDQENKNYLVTAVFEDTPINSYYRFDILISFETLNATLPPDFGVESYDILWNHWNQFTTYVLLDATYDEVEFEDIAHPYIAKYMGPQMNEWKKSFGESASFKTHFQPMSSIYLSDISPYDYIRREGDRIMLFLSIVAILIIAIACINYINLTTAKSAQRSREVGLRKVIGANRNQLMVQFLFESILVNLFALVIAITIIQIVASPFNQLIQKEVMTDNMYDRSFFGVIVICFFSCILISGLYPALFLSTFKVIESLKGILRPSSRKLSLRNSLVLFQFAISILLISGIYTIVLQLKHLDDINLGFIKDRTITLRVPVHQEFKNKINSFREAAVQLVGIENASNSQFIPGVMNYGRFFNKYNELGDLDNGAKATKGTRFFSVDEHYLNTFDIKLIAGRNFSGSDSLDHDAVIINNQAVKDIGFEGPEDAVGSFIGPPKLRVIGVFEDYHHESPKVAVMPMVLQNKGLANTRNTKYNRDPWPGQFLSIRFNSENPQTVIKELKSLWESFFPNTMFDYFFMDENYSIQHAGDQQLAKIIGIFSIVAVLITCMGLFGLTLYTTLKRTKEIGIRKALGAPGRIILTLLSKESFKLILIASIIALPISYWGIRQWLDNFASRIDITPWMFIIPVFTIILIAGITVSWQIVKATRANPINALRYE